MQPWLSPQSLLSAPQVGYPPHCAGCRKVLSAASPSLRAYLVGGPCGLAFGVGKDRHRFCVIVGQPGVQRQACRPVSCPCACLNWRLHKFSCVCMAGTQSQHGALPPQEDSAQTSFPSLGALAYATRFGWQAALPLVWHRQRASS